ESNKTEKATPKKRRDERKKGNVFQSKDVVSVVLLLIAFILIMKMGLFIIMQLEAFYRSQLDKVATLYELNTATAVAVLKEMVQVFFISTLPIIIILALTVFVISGIQTRFLFTVELLKFKYNRISIIQGFKRMFSLRSIVQLVKSLIKVIVIMSIIYISIKDLLVLIPDTYNAGIGDNLSFMKDRIMAMVYKICLIFLGVAILDYGYQKYEYEKKLRMTKQEVKDEYKLTEGDPFIKGRIREKQQKMSLNRMIQQVPSADVIVRNPTHYAVALKYDIEKDPAPIVVAKGQDYMAKRIIEIGEKHQILITENKPLAKGLYEGAEVNEYIPLDFYEVVAELLAWVYKNENKGKGTV
ncbi:MAG: flagellar biosynthesis protein FlhB, partial [Eubacteriales bacterium]|nr:flagellar biosynthesis protein FlhB [Eubacteriales bacterium]